MGEIWPFTRRDPRGAWSKPRYPGGLVEIRRYCGVVSWGSVYEKSIFLPVDNPVDSLWKLWAKLGKGWG